MNLVSEFYSKPSHSSPYPIYQKGSGTYGTCGSLLGKQREWRMRKIRQGLFSTLTFLMTDFDGKRKFQNNKNTNKKK